MKKLLRKPKFFKYLFSKKYENLYVLDLGRSSVKLALVEINKQSKEATILRVAEELHTHNTGATDEVEHIKQITSTVKRAFDSIFSGRKARSGRTKDIVIGLASEMVYGHNFSYIYKRENPEAKIDLRELKNAIHNAELKAYEDIRRRFVVDSGYSETDVLLINSSIQDVRIDGYKVTNPIGFDGEELYISVFNAYLPIFYKNIFDEVARQLKFNLTSLIYEPYAVFSALRRKHGEEFEGIIIDIGGKTTRVSLARKGKFEDIRTFSFGGESFTRRIASHFEIGFWEAENIKLRYSNGNLSGNALGVVEDILQGEISLFLSALEMILKEFSRTTLLPGEIFVHGGGGHIPLIDDIIRKRKWKRELSFLKPPKIHILDPAMFENIKIDESVNSHSQLVSVAGIADHLLHISIEKDTLLTKTLSRMVKLIQDQ
ncbi:MAG: cell division FtsA domain-containing protein [Candidatus Spechtbacterales bacterium]